MTAAGGGETPRMLGRERCMELSRLLLSRAPGGRETAPALFAESQPEGSPSIEDAGSSIIASPAWASEAGAVRLRERGADPKEPGLLVVWLAPGPTALAAFPSQLTLDLPAGRYSILTFDAGSLSLAGSESAAGGPLVCGPPFGGSPLVVIARPVQMGEREE